MEENRKITNADEFISALDRVNTESKELIEMVADYTDKGFVEELGEGFFEDLGRHMDMKALAHCDDRALALKTFARMDEGRRARIVAALRGNIQDLKDELDRRSRGLSPGPDSPYVDNTEEELKGQLSVCERFAGELGLGNL